MENYVTWSDLIQLFSSFWMMTGSVVALAALIYTIINNKKK